MKPTDPLPHPEDWNTAVVGRCVEVKRGVSWSKDQEHTAPYEGAVPVIGISNVQDRLLLDKVLYLSGLKPKAIENKRIEQGWSVLVGSNGNRQRIGNAIYIAEDAAFLFASFLIAAKPRADSGIAPEFFFRWLRSEPVQSYLSASSEGSTGLSNLSHSFFRKMTIAYPGEVEQAAITRLLDAVDGVIDRVQEAESEARALKQAHLQNFFYAAIGITAYADRPAKSLPAGWSLALTESLLASEPKNGISPKASSQPPGIPTFSIAAIRDGRVDLEQPSNLKYTEIPQRVVDKFRVYSGDILVVRGNANPDLVGKAGRVGVFPENCIYPDITIRVVFRQGSEGSVMPEYAVLAWNHPVVHNQILRRAKTSNGTLKINGRDVRQIVMPVPPRAKQEEIVGFSMTIDSKVRALSAKRKALEQLKKSLMHDLLTGTVRVDPAILQEKQA